MATASLLIYLAPLALLAAGVVSLRDRRATPERALRLTRLASLGALGAAALVVLTVVLAGPLTSPLIGVAGLGLQIQLDALSAMMFALVSFVGAVVIQFSRNYMDGDPRHGAFMGGLALVLGAVMLLVLSGNIVQLLLAWTATSLALHRMLLFYRERPGARLAARKKFLVARVGDSALITSATLVYFAFGTGEIAAITAAAGAGDIPTGAAWAAGLIAVAALLKSAVFPTHGWLTEVMETPTPVSALLHAGIINAGGFLVIRFADLMLASAGALHLLAIAGGLTAAIASLVMITQTSVKVSLAWSTVAQMGFMLLQCGFGAFTAAALHIVAHALYKAHAFLNAGNVVDKSRAGLALPATAPSLAKATLALTAAAGIAVAAGLAFGVTLETKPALVVLGAILVMGLTHLLLRLETADGGLLGMTRAVAIAGGVAVLYFALQMGTELLLQPTVPLATPTDPMTVALMISFLMIFAGVALAQILAPAWANTPGLKGFQRSLRHGLYANDLFNRLVGGTPGAARV
ncbi:MAG: NADH-quinone oxidoreductase subunit L [Pseudomonadota bacterium]